MVRGGLVTWREGVEMPHAGTVMKAWGLAVKTR